MTGRGNVKAAIRKNVFLTPPIIRRRISRNGRINLEIRTHAATCLPAIAFQGVGAVAGQQPLIIKC